MPLQLKNKRVTSATRGLSISALFLMVSQTAMSNDMYEQEMEGKWLVRLMALNIQHTRIRSNVEGIGGDIDIPSATEPGLDFSYFATKHWAVESQGGISKTDYRIVGSAQGDFDIGSVETLSFGLTLQHHFYPTPNLKPYLGIGVIHSRTRSVKPANNIPDFDVEDITSLTLNTGVDYQLDGNWFASASLRYLLIPTYSAKGDVFDTEIKLNALVFGIGAAYRF